MLNYRRISKPIEIKKPLFKFKARAFIGDAEVIGYYFYDEARNDGKHYLHMQDIIGNMRECRIHPDSLQILK